MTLWENENDITDFYRKDTHLEAMKQSKSFSSKIHSIRIQKEDLMSWKDAKKLIV
jgi:heme-degrading monooxygenase HmoA